MKSVRKIKKIILFILAFITFGTSVLLAQNEFYYDAGQGAQSLDAADDSNLEMGKLLKENTITPAKTSIIDRIMSYFKLTGGIYEQGDQKATYYVRMIVNILLGLVSFVALIMVVYGFYLMFFSEQDAGYKKAKKVLTGVLMAIAIMGLSRVIITFLFSLFTRLQ